VDELPPDEKKVFLKSPELKRYLEESKSIFDWVYWRFFGNIGFAIATLVFVYLLMERRVWRKLNDT